MPKKKADIKGILGLLVAVFILFFGDNIYEQKTGESIFHSSSPMVETEFPRNTTSPIDTLVVTESPNSILPSSSLPAEIVDEFGVVMRLVPAGEFTMGSENGNDDEKPAHQVYIDAFYMDIYEVTNAAYKICVDEGVCEPPQQTKSYTRSSYYDNSQYDDYPVITVDWNQAKAYCEWRGGNLPVEAQWEKAARGVDGRTYPWGNTFDGTKLNYCDKNCSFDWADKTVDDGYFDTAPVGSYERGKSPYGMYDMAGNVWEWVSDWYSETFYPSSPFNNPLGPSSGLQKVLRGGSWNRDWINVRVSLRASFDPNKTHNYGFRCARSLP